MRMLTTEASFVSREHFGESIPIDPFPALQRTPDFVRLLGPTLFHSYLGGWHPPGSIISGVPAGVMPPADSNR
jgi:hypothetical protein